MVESEKPSSAEESAEESGLDGGVDSADVFCVEDDREDSEVDSILLLRVLGRSLVRILLWGMLIKLVGWIMRQILWSAASVKEVGEDLEEAYSTVEFKGSCVQDYGGSSARILWFEQQLFTATFNLFRRILHWQGLLFLLAQQLAHDRICDLLENNGPLQYR